MPDVIVIGSGVSGLTCGVTLLEAGLDVEIWTDRPPLETTSAVAAAVWYPLRGDRDPRIEGWLPVSLERFRGFSSEPTTGIALRGGIELFRVPVVDAWWRDVLPGFRHARADELPPGFVDGFVADGVPVIEMPVYLRWLSSRVEAFGGRIVMRGLENLDEPLDAADVVVNCAGLGARALARDGSMWPVRGQVVWVSNVGLDRYVLDEQNTDGITYIYPRSNDVVCGGTRQPGTTSLEPDPATADAIMDRCIALEPRLKEAKVLAHRVGLRPGRATVRLESERPSPGKLLVHDYGHGGNGVTLSWGCARDVVAWVEEVR